MKATTPADARANAAQITHLAVSPTWDEPWPELAASLPALDTLNLDGCAVTEDDLERLAGHPRLRRLTLGGAQISDLSPVRALPALRELDLRGCRHLSDLSPLAGLPLTWLGLEGCRRLRDLGPLLELPALRGVALDGCDGAELGPVMTHPTLAELSGDEEMLAQWARRDELAGIRPEDVRAGLAADDPARRIEALRQLVTWVELTSARDANAIDGLLEVGPEDRSAERPVPSALLSEALKTTGLDPLLAAQVFSACFRSIRDNLAPAIEAADIVCSRGGADAEIALVDAFLRARRFYDAGHRSWGEDVHEVMIARQLPRLGGTALTHLLDALDDEDLALDQLDALFPIAYGRATDAELDVLDARLRRYLKASEDRRSEEERTELLSAILEQRPPLRERLSDVLTADVEVSWQSRLLDAAGDPSRAREAVIDLVGAVDAQALSVEELAELGPWLDEAIKGADELPVDVASRVVELAAATDEQTWLRPCVLRPLVRERLDWLDALGSPAREHVVKWLGFWQRDEPFPEGVDLTAARARLTGASVEEMTRQVIEAAIHRGLEFAREDLDGALARYAADPFPLKFTASRSRFLAQRLDELRREGRQEEELRLMETLRKLRPHLTWAPKDQQYPLTYLLPLAVERGPDFFAEHVAPWLEDTEIVEPRFAYNLACYQAAHGDTTALCAAIARAIELGKPKSQFREDADFAARLEEPEVKALLEEERRRPRYFAMKRVPYHRAPCRFLDMGYKPNRPAWWKHDWQGGQPLDPRPEGPLRFDLKPYREAHPEMGRALPLLHIGKIPLMHASLVRALEELGARLETIPALLVDPDDGSEHGDYFAVNVLGVLSPDALGRFHGRLSDTSHEAPKGFEAVDGADAPIDGLVLAWIEDTYTLVVYEPLVDALTEAGFDELTFTDLTQIAL